MRSLISFVFVLALISPCLRCDETKINGLYNIINYGAKGDGKSDDAQVCVFYFVIYNFQA